MRVAVIGGGAAGFFSAIAAAETGRAEVHVFEASSRCLEKVRISGGGRCNVTHACFDSAELCKAYPRGYRELRQAFSRFMTIDTVDWFTARGVELKAEADGRMFPVTDDSMSIVACLSDAAKEAGVMIHYRSRVTSISVHSDVFILDFLNGPELSFDKLIIATGGQPKLEGFSWLKKLGHTVSSPVPSLFTFNIPHIPLHELMGLSVESAQVSIVGTDLQEEGPLLITHWGLSGPAVLKLSSTAARTLAEKQYRFTVSVNWLPAFDEQDTLEWINGQRVNSGSAKVRNTNPVGLPRRLWEFLLMDSGISETANWSDLRKDIIKKLLLVIHHQTFHVSGKTTFKEEFVTCGGIELREVDFKTMQSKIVPGLFFAGEVLDIDAVTGGYNFQAAWTTGFIAGKSVVQ
ncbi:MAG: NAD(P)/FAD-dependent oxidoreductase [Bacteroidota bacterium]